MKDLVHLHSGRPYASALRLLSAPTHTAQRSTRMAWFHRAVLAGLLLAAYLWAWTPVRTAWTAQSADLLAHVVNARAANGSIDGPAGGHVLRLTVADAEAQYTAPAGVRFLLPAGVLIFVAPGRPRLGPFFAGHLLLGGLSVALLAGRAAGLPGGLVLSRFVQAYGVDAYSLAVPALVWARSRSVGSP